MSTPVNCTWRNQLESLGYATLVTAHISPFIIYVIRCSSFFPVLVIYCNVCGNIL